MPGTSPSLLRRFPCAWILLALACGAFPAAGADADADSPDAPLRFDGSDLRVGDHTLHVRIASDVGAERAQLLRGWLAETVRATLTAYGRFPLQDATVRISEVDDRGDSPVPWGQTLRSGSTAVLLYVRRDASLDELRADWTAVHELSHLFHPYLGDDGRWLAEGLASYYQNVLRARSGLLTEEEAWRRLDAGFGRGRREDSGAPLEQLSRSHRGTMRVYWAGAAYWLEMDLALRDEGSGLDAVLSRYADCCLRGTGEVAPEDFIAELDRIAGGHGFRDRYERYASSRQFPALDAAYTKLGIIAGSEGLEFSDRGDALRRAVMGRR